MLFNTYVTRIYQEWHLALAMVCITLSVYPHTWDTNEWNIGSWRAFSLHVHSLVRTTADSRSDQQALGKRRLIVCSWDTDQMKAFPVVYDWLAAISALKHSDIVSSLFIKWTKLFLIVLLVCISKGTGMYKICSCSYDILNSSLWTIILISTDENPGRWFMPSSL